ncbi:MAG TPA: transposase [Planctomycetota bacterium]|jgi:hypothetical protein
MPHDVLPEFYRRRLPRWQPNGATVFLTYRLAGSLPQAVLDQLSAERERLNSGQWREGEKSGARHERISKAVFGRMDEFLAEQLRRPAPESPRWLADERIARVVRENMRYWDGVRVRLLRFTIMPNHVHLLFEPLSQAGQPAPQQPAPREQTGQLSQAGQPAPQQPAPLEQTGQFAPRWPLRTIMQGLKGYTAREANQLLGRRGAFWQDESFDHWVRDEAEYNRIVWYIDNNPVAAGLCREPGEWKWSSAGEESGAGC